MPEKIQQLIVGLDLNTAKALSLYLDGDRDGNFLEALNERIANEDPAYFSATEEKEKA